LREGQKIKRAAKRNIEALSFVALTVNKRESEELSPTVTSGYLPSGHAVWMPTDTPKSTPSASSLEKRGPTKSTTCCREFLVAQIERSKSNQGPVFGFEVTNESCLRGSGVVHYQEEFVSY
jgi:hypothetical protein